jgi:DNA-binding XRE family transcriptional regulator
LMSKAELARKAGVSPLTIDRIERGESCRMDTKRKIILALGFGLAEKTKVFSDNDNDVIKMRGRKKSGARKQ